MNAYVEPVNNDEPRSAIRILVVDDEEGARQTLTDVLEEMGYLICTAANAAEALRAALAQEFDIALIDVRLPDMVGTELLRQLKAKHPDLACVIVTAYASVSSSVEALNEGASAYVVKPFEIPTLVTVIREQAEKQQLARENRRMLQVLTALQEISEIALATHDLESLAGKLLDRVIDALGGSGGALAIDKEEKLTPVPGLIVRGNATGTAAKRAHRESALLLLPDINGAKKVAVPLSVHDEVIGGMQINAPADRYFTQRDLRLAMLLADRVALALENARLHERERRSAREAQTLFHVAEALVSTLHLDDRLDVIARTLAEVSGCKRCLIFLRRDRALAPAWAFGLSEDEAETFSVMGTDLLRIEGSLKRAVETRQTLLMQDAGEDPDVSKTFLNLWRIQTALVLPLVIGTEAIGVVLLDTPGTTYQVSDHDIRLCEAVANQAAVAIENARAFERERTVAEVLQKSFLPSVPERLGALRLTARYYAALAEAQVGGDFYDVIEFPDGRIGLLMADVSGKGVSAAVHAAMGKYMLRAYSFENPDPGEALRRLNYALFAFSAQEVFITMFFAVIDLKTGEMHYINAGHPPALIVRGSDNDRGMRLGSTIAPIGAFREADFTPARATIAPGDMLVLYTDGVTEARSGHEFFGVERLEDVIAEHAAGGPDSTADAIYAAVQRFAGRTAHDDIALVVAEALPPGK